VFAPAKLPANLAELLGNEIERNARSDAFRGNLEPLGVFPTVLTGRAFAEFQATNIGFGGDDWKTLFFTSRTMLGPVILKVAGIPVPVAKKA
jgi:hypothetical protein